MGFCSVHYSDCLLKLMNKLCVCVCCECCLYKWKLSSRVLMKLDHFSSLGMISISLSPSLPPLSLSLASGHTFPARLFVFSVISRILFLRLANAPPGRQPIMHKPRPLCHFKPHMRGNRKGRLFCPIKSGLRCDKGSRPGLFPHERSFWVVRFVTFLPSIDPKLILPSLRSAAALILCLSAPLFHRSVHLCSQQRLCKSNSSHFWAARLPWER